MKTIGKYEVLGLLGMGGMGRVYKVRLPVAGRIVALKLLAPREELEMLVGLEELEARFLDEVRALGALNDPHVAAVLDFDRDARGRPFFVMEYCCMNLGGLLGEVYESETPTRTLPVDAAVRYAEQLLLALEHLHFAGMVHRDVKPFNVLLTAQDRVKLIDFGLSRVGGAERATPGGMKVGTPCYTAPEQEDDPESADLRADLYSAGVVLWRMLTGRVPAERADEHVSPSRAARGSGVAGVLDADWDEFLVRCVELEPGDRFQTARAMRQELLAVHADWKRRLRQACTLEDPAAGQGCLDFHPRREPRKVRPGQAPAVFPVDALLRPRCFAPPAADDCDPAVVRHAATGLAWQRQGSDYPLDWPQAHEYVAALNAQGFAGHQDWRLPTVDELLTILAPARALGDYCQPPCFGPQRWLWSADAKSFAAAWYVDALLGFAGFQDTTCAFHARAVRG